MSPVLIIASIIFGLVVLFFAVYSFFLVYHLLEFALNKGSAIVLIIFFVFVSVVILFTISMYVSQINWGAESFPFLKI